MAAVNELAPIIIKKIVKGGHGHHGGAWKVAYADFVTAMMAFFLLMWLLNATTEDQKQGISEYFSASTVSNTTGGAGGLLGGAAVSSPGAMTSRTAVPSVSLDLRPTSGAQDGEAEDEGGGAVEDEDPDKTANMSEEELKEELEKRKEEAFQKAEAEIKQALEATPELKDLQKHLVIDQTPEGLRIQIVDREGKPMFASGSSRMPKSTRTLLAKITQVVQKLPNKFSLSGHTDATPFRGSRKGYGNWELSSNRALASRRVMVESGLKMEKISHVTSKEATEPLIKDNPNDAPQPANCDCGSERSRKKLESAPIQRFQGGQESQDTCTARPRARPIIPARLERPATEIDGFGRNSQTRFQFVIFTNIRGKLFPNATKLYIHRV